MNAVAPLGAMNIDDILKLVVLVLFFVVPALIQALSKKKQPPKPAPGKPQDRVAKEVEDFLEKRAKQPRREGARPTAAKPQLPELPAVPRVIDRGKPVSGQSEKPMGGQIAQQVDTYLSEKKLEQHAAELGTNVAGADRQINEHMHQTFDHRVGQLAGTSNDAAVRSTGVESADVPPEVSATSLASIFVMLTDPDSIRQAIVLNEILRRPEDRWA